MDQADRKPWDSACPQCQQALQRAIELSAGIYDEVDHGGGLYPVRPPDYCTHEGEHQA
jgi:hypothetical protein